MKNVLIIGATSAIASETAKLFASQHYNLTLAARDLEKLDSVKKDIIANYPDTNVNNLYINVLDYSSHKDLLNSFILELKRIDIVLIAFGSLPEQNEIENNFEEIHKQLEINMLAVISLTTVFAEYFESIKSGTLAVISSVAGDRGRKSNYIYGTAKGALSIYLQGLRNRLHSLGVNVITIKPGFVDTPMTAHMTKNFMFAQPADIAKGIINAIDNKKDVVYLPSYWSIIMLVVKHIPEFIFKKLSL
jgi:short-subunit dehydrogenase